MTKPRPRVFISSVMGDYGEYRDAALHGIRQAGCEPVRAEDFPAGTVSSRTACLDGVRSADALVLILGERYGFVGPSGLSPTEEEYHEARNTHKRLLVFLQAGVVHEPGQRELVEKVQDYVDGHWRKTFRTPKELTDLVREAVEGADLTHIQSGDSAQRRIESRLAWDPANEGYDSGVFSSGEIPWLRTVWTTLRDEEVIDPISIGDDKFKRTLLRLGHECDPPLFEYEQKTHSIITPSVIRIHQGNRQDQYLTSVEVDINGTFVITQSITYTETEHDHSLSHLHVFVIDPDIVRDRISRAWHFAASWWNDLDIYRRHDPLLYNLGIYNIGYRTFQPAPRVQQSIGLSIMSSNEPIIVFDKPRNISRHDLAIAAEISGVMGVIERRFRHRDGR